MLCMLCYVMLCYVMLCYVMLCYVIYPILIALGKLFKDLLRFGKVIYFVVRWRSGASFVNLTDSVAALVVNNSYHIRRRTNVP